MGSEWEPVSIEEIRADKKGAIAIGPFGSRIKSDCYVENGVPVIRGTNISGGPAFENNFVYISEEKAESLGSCNVYEDDLVFPHRGSIGEVGIVPSGERYVISSSLMKLTCDTKRVYPRYLFYFFKSHIGKHELLRNASTVGTPGIGQPLTSLKSIRFLLPKKPVQKSIAHILGTLDDKIELNRGMNETLESMARALFKSWFVDFDPVIDKALADTQPTVQGLIDGGTLRMGDGYRAKRIELAEVGLPFVRAGNLQHGGFDFSDAELLCEESCVDAGEKNSQPFDVAFTSKGTVGRMTMVMPQTQPFVYSPQVCWWRVIDQSTLNPHVLYRWMESSQFMHQVAKVKGNTDMADYVSLRDQRAMHVSLPPIEEQAALAKELSSIDHKMAGNREQSQTLTKLRDTLLPQLLSGSLRIPDAEQLVAESVQ